MTKKEIRICFVAFVMALGGASSADAQMQACYDCLNALIRFGDYDDPGCRPIREVSYFGEAGFFAKGTDELCHSPSEYKDVLENWCHAWGAKGSNCITDVRVAPLNQANPHPANVSRCTANNSATAGGLYIVLACGRR
jgi:hypothetical protein